MSKLIVIATPIGNLLDVSQNTVNNINQIEYLFCEDTRTTLKLLKLIGVTKIPQLISYHKFNEHEKLDDVIKTIKKYQCGLVSDAGYPGICDPGYLLVNACHLNEIRVEVIDGPCSITHAVVQSGMGTDGYIFIGFIDKKQKTLLNDLKKLESLDLPVVAFISVHQFNYTMQILQEHFPTMNIYIGRELSKKFETYYVGSILTMPETVLKGEFTIIMKFKIDKQNILHEEQNFKTDINLLLDSGINLKQACKYIAKKNNVKASVLYNYWQKTKAF